MKADSVNITSSTEIVRNVAGKPYIPDTMQDRFLLRSIARWRIARAEAQLAWAKQDEASLFLLHDVRAKGVYEALDAMDEACQTVIKCCGKPSTVRGARALLSMAQDILLHQREGTEVHPLSEGPVLEIIQKVSASLEWEDYDQPIGEHKKRELSLRKKYRQALEVERRETSTPSLVAQS
jgi:hypothetical protein